MQGKLVGWALVFALFLPLIVSGSATAASHLTVEQPCATSPIVLSELQPSAPGATGATNYRYEFVELYNCTPDPIDLADYTLVFYDTVAAEIIRLPLSGDIDSENFLWILHNSYATFLDASTLPEPYLLFGGGNLNALPAGGGYVSLLRASDDADDGELIDTVSYGKVADADQVTAPLPPTGQSIKRCVDADGFFANTGDNARDFLVTPLPTLSALFKPGPACETLAPDDPPEEPPEEPQPACDGLTISELLPNPAGADGGQEFIEIHNPTTQSVVMAGCALRLNEAGKTFDLPDETLTPGAYRAFYDSQTGITLPNAAGGTIWLLTTSEEQSVTYPQNMSNNQTWALISGSWKATLQPTPSAANQLVLPPATPPPPPKSSGSRLTPCAANQERNPETNRCRLITTSQPTLVPCRSNQERNPATNRCRNISSVSTSLVPCNIGQTRNPATNRCRAALITASALKPCKLGQTRNPATNRCRASGAAASTLKACAANQERNPATNRCRLKSSAAATLGLADVKDINTPTVNTPRWWLAGGAVFSAVAYGVYEWRQELKTTFGRLKNRFLAGGTPR